MNNKFKSSFYNIIPLSRKNNVLRYNKIKKQLTTNKLIKSFSPKNNYNLGKSENVSFNNNSNYYSNSQIFNDNVTNNYEQKNKNINIGNNLNKSDNFLLNNYNYNNNLEDKYKKIIKLNQKSRLKRIYKPYWFEGVEKIIEKESNDPKIPKGLEYINLFIKQFNIKQFNESSNYNKIYKKRINESDIFFNNEENKIENYKNKKNKSNSYKYLVNFNNDSDIFLLKNDENSIKKSGEICYITKKYDNLIKYSANNQSKTGWGLKVLKPCLLNHNSSDRNLFNYRIKNITRTRKEIEDRCKLDYNSFQPTHKQKGLSEFYDLTNKIESHDNIDYLNKYNKFPNIFHKNDNFCNESFKIHNCYKNLLDEPFKRYRKKNFSL
jgi:hypothetical protein